MRQEQNHSINPEAMQNLIDGKNVKTTMSNDRLTTESIDQVFDAEQHFKQISVDIKVTSYAPKVFQQIL